MSFFKFLAHYFKYGTTETKKKCLENKLKRNLRDTEHPFRLKKEKRAPRR